MHSDCAHFYFDGDSAFSIVAPIVLSTPLYGKPDLFHLEFSSCSPFGSATGWRSEALIHAQKGDAVKSEMRNVPVELAVQSGELQKEASSLGAG